MRANAIIKACDAADVDGSGTVGWPVFRDSLAKVDIIVEDTELVAVGAAVTELAPGAEASVAEPSDYQVPYTRLVPRLRFFLDSDVRGELRLPLRGPVKDPNYEYNMAVAQAQADRRAAEAAARAAEQAARLAHQQGAHVPEMSEAERLAQAFARADQAVQDPQALATAQLAEEADARAKAAHAHAEAQAKARAEAEARTAAEAAAASRPPAGGHQIPSHVFSEVPTKCNKPRFSHEHRPSHDPPFPSFPPSTRRRVVASRPSRCRTPSPDKRSTAAISTTTDSVMCRTWTRAARR